METITIYNYQNPRQFLLDYLSSKQKADASFSVRKWAKDMGMKGHPLLVMLLQGKRKLRIQHCNILNNGIGLKNNEQAYFQTLVQYDNAKTIEEKNYLAVFLQDLHPGDDFRSKELNEFMVISNWIHMAILAMTELKNFKGTEEEIHSLLKGKVSISEVRSAIIRLMDLNLLKWGDTDKLTPTYNDVKTQDDILSEGAREYHRQVLELAKDALTEQTLNEREFQSFTMAVAKEKISLAKDMIRKFRTKLIKAVSDNGDYVYQTSIQFFQLTQNPKYDIEDKSVARDTNVLEKGNKNVN